MRLLAWLLSLARGGRGPSRGPLAVFVALAGAAMVLGMAVGSSHRSAKGPFVPVVPAQADGARPIVLATAATKRVAGRRGRRPRRGGRAYYRHTARRRVPTTTPARFMPLYREAERVYDVNWRLIASIHRQETAFSTHPSTYHGLNAFGCCAGPMQFNVTNGPVSTWKRYRQAFRAGRRPKRYPHRTRFHPSIYDDFDAIMAAGSLLSDSGAGPSLDLGAWTAAYSYYGHDLFGVTYASQVLARAEAWQRDGFCPNCALDDGLVAEFDDAYGAPVRRQLLAAERRRKKHKRNRDRKGDRRDRHGRRKGADDGGADRSTPPSARPGRPTGPSPPRPRRRRTAPTEAPSPAPPPTPPATPPPTTAPAPAAAGCSPVRRLLGCKP